MKIPRAALAGGLILGWLWVASVQAARFHWQQFKGMHRRLSLNKPPGQTGIEPRLNEFEAPTGTKVVAGAYPEDRFRAKVLVELPSGARCIDLSMSLPAQEGLKDMRGRGRVPADLADPRTQSSKVGLPPWSPPVVAVAEVRDAVGAAIGTSIPGGDDRGAVNKAAADTRRSMAETETRGRSGGKFLDRVAPAMVHMRTSEPEEMEMTLDRTARYYFWFSFPGLCPLGSGCRMR